MEKLVWRSPSIDILKQFRILPFKGSDTSWVNLYLLRRKYKLEIAVYEDVLFRYYHGKNENRQGYGFPLSTGKPDYEKAFKMIERDAADRGGMRFCLCDEGQKEILSAFFAMEWNVNQGDSDYYYERVKWLNYAGKKYQRLKNRVNLFNRIYPEATYFPIDSDRRLQDALRVAHIWQEEHQENGIPDEELIEELNCITDVGEHWEELGMIGGVLYVDHSPVAMNMASCLSTDSVDFHFDKAVGQLASKGAVAAARSRFAASDMVRDRQFFNLEEDMNIPGLRQSKGTYRPVFMLSKSYGSVK